MMSRRLKSKSRPNLKICVDATGGPESDFEEESDLDSDSSSSYCSEPFKNVKNQTSSEESEQSFLNYSLLRFKISYKALVGKDNYQRLLKSLNITKDSCEDKINFDVLHLQGCEVGSKVFDLFSNGLVSKENTDKNSWNIFMKSVPAACDAMLDHSRPCTEAQYDSKQIKVLQSAGSTSKEFSQEDEVSIKPEMELDYSDDNIDLMSDIEDGSQPIESKKMTLEKKEDSYKIFNLPKGRWRILEFKENNSVSVYFLKFAVDGDLSQSALVSRRKQKSRENKKPKKQEVRLKRNFYSSSNSDSADDTTQMDRHFSSGRSVKDRLSLNSSQMDNEALNGRDRRRTILKDQTKLKYSDESDLDIENEYRQLMNKKPKRKKMKGKMYADAETLPKNRIKLVKLEAASRRMLNNEDELEEETRPSALLRLGHSPTSNRPLNSDSEGSGSEDGTDMLSIRNSRRIISKNQTANRKASSSSAIHQRLYYYKERAKADPLDLSNVKDTDPLKKKDPRCATALDDMFDITENYYNKSDEEFR